MKAILLQCEYLGDKYNNIKNKYAILIYSMIAQEVILYKKSDIPDDAFNQTLRELSDDYLSKHLGFINRFYAKKNDSEWLLFVFFNTLENAHDCIEDYKNWDKAHNLLDKIKDNGLKFNHYEMFEPII